MNEVKIISKALQSEDYKEGLKDLYEYLTQDGVGMKKAETLIDQLEKIEEV